MEELSDYAKQVLRQKIFELRKEYRYSKAEFKDAIRTLKSKRDNAIMWRARIMDIQKVLGEPIAADPSDNEEDRYAALLAVEPPGANDPDIS